MTISVLVVDDQKLVRTGFRMILDSEDDIEVVAEAADGNEALAVYATVQPDVVLMDIRMPNMDGVEATRGLVERDSSALVLILTTFDLDEYVYAALRAGASGFLLKDTPPEQLIEAVRAVARGDALIAPSVTRRLIETFAHKLPRGEGEPPVRKHLEALTDREVDVLTLMARGLSNAEIAAELFVGETTVKTHVGHILTKLAARDRVQAVVAAYESGLVVPGGTD
ncbi:MAG: Transcriptional regulatory protein DegU [Acidimicrobiales bacterium]|nr:MAG: DNA-binding response regulator [Actinomycetota bacterium]MBV6508541.1 Transcriptional regulatory protein DegU [Acidimicrobiales bacterium]RIK05144.1 MAG: DNA-binding response regulator [Acidobacteriota bacterium]